MYDFNFRPVEEFQRVFVHPVGNVIDQASDPRVDQHLGAVDAWEVCDVAGAALGGDAVQGGLDDSVGLGMDGADAVAVNQQVPDLVAVGLPGGGPVEPGGQDAFIPDHDAAHIGAVAGAAL